MTESMKEASGNAATKVNTSVFVKLSPSICGRLMKAFLVVLFIGDCIIAESKRSASMKAILIVLAKSLVK
jgi:hypothetical protein